MLPAQRVETTKVAVCVGDVQKLILCAPGMALNELHFILGAAFEVDAFSIAGLVSEEGVCSPVSLVCRAPSLFAQGLFALLLKPNATGEIREEPEVLEGVVDDDATSGLAAIASSTNLGALDVMTAMGALYQAADDNGHLNRYSFANVLDNAIHNTQTIPRDADVTEPLSALFDIIRQRTSIHAASQVPASCVRKLGAGRQ